jgi:predicted CXXCH cytochrome family protein
MTRAQRGWSTIACATLSLSIALGGCVDEKIVYRNGANFVTPPSAAASFLGYTDVTNKTTVCGNCHTSQQARWVTTKHADAWNTLATSGSQAGTCEACHSVNNLGNAITDTAAGWRSTHDSRYKDVQCESCHGPGLQHVTAPTRGQMLAAVTVDTSATRTNGCAECHTGTHHPFVDEWKKSDGHGESHSIQPAPTIPSSTNNRADCQGCHNTIGILAAWGVNTDFIEKNSTTYVTSGVTCAVCHDPHGSANPHQLRYAIDVRDVNNNLCMRCHQRRAVPDPASTSGPHSEQGPLLLGDAGWWPPNLNLGDTLSASHGSARNPKLCATCHVQSYTVNDKLTGKFVFQVTGHRFLPIPCVDANGQPTDDQSCSVSVKSFKACVNSGCHGSESVARSAYTTVQARIAAINVELRRLLALVPASAFVVGPVYTTARGAKFNADLADQPGSFVHNPFLVEQLLRASITQVAKDYNLTPSPGYGLSPKYMKAGN